MFGYDKKYLLLVCSILGMVGINIGYQGITFYDLLWYLSMGILLFIRIQSYFFFSIGLGMYFTSNIFSFFHILGADEFLVFSFYFFLLGIFDLGRERYEYFLGTIDKKMSVEIILIFCSILILGASIYFDLVTSILQEIAFIFTLIFSYRKNILSKKKR